MRWALGMALAAIVVADTHRHRRHTYGLYRLEILAALANAVLLFGVCGYVLFEAAQRLRDPTEVLTWPLLVVAVIGLAVNAISWWLLREGAEESLNVEGALAEVWADMIGSVAVIVSALIILVTGWWVVDAIAGALGGLYILPRAWRLGRRALRILVQAAPEHIDPGEVRSQLLAVSGVQDVHNLHLWTLTSSMEVASAHLVTAEGRDPHPVIDEARALLADRFGIDHTTFQVEPDTHEGCEGID